MLVEDYVMRQIRKVAEAIANLANGGAGEMHEEIEANLDEAYRSLTGLDRPLADELDPRSLARMMGEPRAIRAFAELLKAHGDFHVRRQNAHGAEQRYLRALAMLDHADAGAETDALRAALHRALAAD